MMLAVLLLSLSEPTSSHSVEGTINVETEEGGTAICNRFILSSDDLLEATPGFDIRTGEPVIFLVLTDKGQIRFQASQQDCLGKRIAIYVGEESITSPVLREYITGKDFQLSGNFSIEQTHEIAEQLKNEQ